MMALTYPGIRNVSPMGGLGEKNSLAGVLDERNRYTVLLPIAAITVLNAANLVWAGPVTTRIMKERKHQGELSSYPLFLGWWEEALER